MTPPQQPSRFRPRPRHPLHWLFLPLIAAGVIPGLGPRGREGDDRGDVPGWVMITMMTAIVVIALLAVFQEAVLTAVTNAFASITGD